MIARIFFFELLLSALARGIVTATNPASHFILHLYVCMYLCMSVMLRNANLVLYAACAKSTARARGRTIVISRPQGTSSRV